MTILQSLTDAVRRKAAENLPLGYRVTFDLGPDGVIFWDGTQTPAVIGNEAPAGGGDVDTVLGLSIATMQKMLDGSLNPTFAYMTGSLKVQGSMGVALKISQMLED
ncbi:MAG TPA: SCP2 sterol-binding domain-containing protein [Stellaceae bacterium]|jgi:putative sterol carrier protein